MSPFLFAIEGISEEQNSKHCHLLKLVFSAQIITQYTKVYKIHIVHPIYLLHLGEPNSNVRICKLRYAMKSTVPSTTQML
jgi:hypothetical protein